MTKTPLNVLQRKWTTCKGNKDLFIKCVSQFEPIISDKNHIFFINLTKYAEKKPGQSKSSCRRVLDSRAAYKEYCQLGYRISNPQIQNQWYFVAKIVLHSD